MPIIGMTDRVAAFPRIGELRKGGEKTDPKRPGKDLDYFRFTSKDPEVAAAFQAAYGDKPQHINIFFPYANKDENFETWMEEWKGGGLVHRCDGRHVVRYQKDGHYTDPLPGSMECPYQNGQRQRTKEAPGCKEVGRLKIIIPELGRLAYVTALTSSVNDLVEISANLAAFEALRGSLVGIPFVLSRVPRLVSTPEIIDKKETGKRVRREKWLWHIDAAPQWVQAQIGVMRRAALPVFDHAPLALGSGYGDEGDAPIVVDHEPANGNGHDEDAPQAPNGNGNGRNGHDAAHRPAAPETPQNQAVTGDGNGGNGNGRSTASKPSQAHVTPPPPPNVDPETGEILDDVEDGTFEDVPTAAPADPHAVVERLRRAAGNGRAKPTARTITALHLTFQEVFGEGDDYRAVVRAVFGVNGKSDLTDQQAKAFLNWLKPNGELNQQAYVDALMLLGTVKTEAAPAGRLLDPGRVADLRATIDGSDGDVTAGFVADRIAMTGLVGQPEAGMYLMRQWPHLPEGKVLEFPTKLKVKTALALFDYVMDTAEKQAA